MDSSTAMAGGRIDRPPSRSLLPALLLAMVLMGIGGVTFLSGERYPDSFPLPPHFSISLFVLGTLGPLVLLAVAMAERRKAMAAQHQAEIEARKQREQLDRLTRVAALGKLAGALAHELNQPLAAILTNAQAARRLICREPVDLREIREILDDIVREDKRAGEVIRHLRALFLKGEAKMQPLDINELVRDTLGLAHSDLTERKVPVVLELGPSPAGVQGDRVQLQQVLLNLIANACEAMSGLPPESRRLSLTTAADGKGDVHIAVMDTGPGIAPELMEKVFESFFTTKTQGMGVGLCISRTIIAEHGGRIEVANNPGGGAIFRITLPASAGVTS